MAGLAAYAATSCLAERSRRLMRWTRISVIDFVEPSLAVYWRVLSSPVT